MKHFLITVLCLLISASPSFAKSDTPEVGDALVQWKEAIESGDVDAVMKLYDKNAIMISTFAQKPMTKRKEITEYFKKVVENPDISIEIEDSHPRVFGDIAVSSGRYNLSYMQEGEEIATPARFSFVYKLENGKWMIIDQHSSRVPLPDKQ